MHRRNRTLLADGLELDLGARAIEVLLALIDAGGALVSKDELLTRVWSDAIVEENNLHVQIFALRRALGADRDLIRTVPRRGYSFTGHVMASPRSASAAHVDPEPAASPASNLPILLGELIGRETDLRQVVELQTSYRLLTLHRAWRNGKTSLGHRRRVAPGRAPSGRRAAGRSGNIGRPRPDITVDRHGARPVAIAVAAAA